MDEETLKKLQELEDKLTKLEKSKADPVKKLETRLAKFEKELATLSSGLADTQVEFIEFKELMLAEDEDKQMFDVEEVQDKCRGLEDRISLLETARNKLHAL